MEKRKDLFLERTAVLRSQASWETPSGFWVPQGYFYVLDGMQSGGTKEGKDFPWEIVLVNQSSEFICAIWKRVGMLKILYLTNQLSFLLSVKVTPDWSTKEKAGHCSTSCENNKYTCYVLMFLEKKQENSWHILIREQTVKARL